MEMTISLTDLLMIIGSISILLLMICLIPLLIQLRQTARRAEMLISNLNQDLPSILTSLRATSSELQKTSEHINSKLDETDAIISTAKYAGESLLLTSNLIRSALNPAILKFEGISNGIKTFINVFTNPKFRKAKETEKNE